MTIGIECTALQTIQNTTEDPFHSVILCPCRPRFKFCFQSNFDGKMSNPDLSFNCFKIRICIIQRFLVQKSNITLQLFFQIPCVETKNILFEVL